VRSDPSYLREQTENGYAFHPDEKRNECACKSDINHQRRRNPTSKPRDAQKEEKRRTAQRWRKISAQKKKKPRYVEANRAIRARLRAQTMPINAQDPRGMSARFVMTRIRVSRCFDDMP